jgi:hypothetical protein
MKENERLTTIIETLKIMQPIKSVYPNMHTTNIQLLVLEHYSNQFINLPDEILLIILKKLITVDVFNLFGINERLDNILYDKIFTSKLTLFVSSSNDLIHRLDDSLIDRSCLQFYLKFIIKSNG